jgi:hypothetical protein
MGLFLDLIHVPVGVTNHMLDGLYKALSDGHDHGDDGIWKPHQSPLLKRLIELFTQRGLDRLAGVKDELQAWLAGHKHQPSAVPVAQPGQFQRWSADELALAKLYLQSLPVAQWTLDDHMLCIDMVVQTYLPPDVLQPEAEWLAVRAGMMGKVQANMAAALTAVQADKVLAALPSTVAGAGAQFLLQPAQVKSLDFARVRAVENVQALADGVRHKMRVLVAADLEQRAFGNQPVGASSLQTKLLDTFGELNRDWRRIAVTEAGEAQTQGYIASVAPGTKVQRVERYDNACAFCRKIDGVVVTVVAADAADKNPDTMVWPGKNNVGRSASPRKRVGDVLVERTADELWQIPAGLAHPHCRGRWVPTIEDQPGDDKDFGDWLRKTLA